MGNKLLIINDFPLIGGAESVVLQVCRYLTEIGNSDGWSLCGMTSRDGPLAEAMGKIGELPLAFIDIQGLKMHWLSLNAWSGVLRAIRAWIEKEHPDVILCNSIWSAIVTERAVRNDISIVCAVHAAIAPKRLMKRIGFNLAGALLVRGIRHWITVSDHLSAEIRRLGIKENRISIIPNGVRIPPFAPVNRTGPFRHRYGISPDGIVAVTIGRLDPGKGQHVLIETIQSLVEDGLDLYLVITGEEYAGSGSEPVYTRILRKMIAANGLQARIVLTGFVDDTDQILQESDIMVSASGEESFGLAVLEGMAAGRPVVVSNVDGHRRLVSDGVSGYLVEWGDVSGFCDAIRRLVLDPTQRVRMGEQARQSALAYDLDATLSRWKNCLQMVAGDGRNDNRRHRSGVDS
ncbi:glycosyltransferase family 4 protein [bacterium]|nr:glycosyltransferase family 4 protein [candidate division CSSED10-310 bacterium]